MRLYKYFLIIAIVVTSNNACSVYKKVFGKNQKENDIIVGKEHVVKQENSANKKELTSHLQEAKLNFEKEKYYYKFNIFKNELAVRYTAKAYPQESLHSKVLYFSIPVYATLVNVRLKDVFGNTDCAKITDIVEFADSYINYSTFKKRYALRIKCSKNPDYIMFDVMYSMPVDIISKYYVKGRTYILDITNAELSHGGTYERRMKKNYIEIPGNFKLYCNEESKKMKQNLFLIYSSSHYEILLYSGKKIDVDSDSVSVFRLSGRYNIPKVKVMARFIKKIITFYRAVFGNTSVRNINVFLHIEKTSFIFGNNIFLGQDLLVDLLSGFMPIKLPRLILTLFYKCNFGNYTDKAIGEFLSDFFVRFEYNTNLDIIRYKRLNVISSYLYKSLVDRQAKKELKNQLKIFMMYFYFVKIYGEDYVKFAKDLAMCHKYDKVKIVSIPKFISKKLSDNRILIIFTKNLKRYYDNLPLKINDTLQSISIAQSACNKKFCNLYVENTNDLLVDPEHKILRLLRMNELIPSFMVLTLKSKVKLKVISKMKRDWKILEDFLRTIRKFVDIEYETKSSADIVVIVHNGDMKFFNEKVKKEFPCIDLRNDILYGKVLLTKYIFGVVNCKFDNDFKMLILLPTFYHLYLFSVEELKKLAWKSIWLWNRKKLIYTEDIIQVK